VHNGSADVGHYFTILSYNDNKWKKYDDSRVSYFPEFQFEMYYGGNFVEEEWGSGSSSNAYVLIY
jgi:hypothetical protein